jgi:dihydropyrimidinase
MFDLVIRGGRVITASDDYVADVAVQGERIAAVGLDLQGEQVVDADGLYVLPGAIDGHVHMRTDRRHDVYDDDARSGSIAAAFGGVTTIIDQAQVPAGTTLSDGLDARLEELRPCLIDYGVHVNLREPSRERVAEIPAIVARGFPSIKLFMNYDTYALPDEIIFAAMQEVAAANGLAIVHAENRQIIDELTRQNSAAGRSGREWHLSARPGALEGEAIHRALALANVAGARCLIFHVTAAEGVREIEAARRRGQEVYGEVLLHHLLLDAAALADPLTGTALELSPPLRTEEHRAALWHGLAEHSLDIVSTDHGPRRRARDDAGALYTPPGTSGIEVRLALVHTYGVGTGRLSLNRWVDVCCTRPARVHGLHRKGQIRPGYDADLVLFDPRRELTLSADMLHSDIDHSTYDGFAVRGFPVSTISRGEVIIDGGELVGEVGRGRLVSRGYDHAMTGPPAGASAPN